MLDVLILRYLTKEGKIAYFVGQLILAGLWAFYMFGIKDYSFRDDEGMFIAGIIGIILVWGGLCLAIWRKKDELESDIKTEVEKPIES